MCTTMISKNSHLKLTLLFAIIFSITTSLSAKKNIHSYSTKKTIDNLEYTFSVQVNEKDINFKSPLVDQLITFHVIKKDVNKSTESVLEDDFSFLVENMDYQDDDEIKFYFDCILVLNHTTKFELPKFFPRKLLFHPNLNSQLVNIYTEEGEFVLQMKNR